MKIYVSTTIAFFAFASANACYYYYYYYYSSSQVECCPQATEFNNGLFCLKFRMNKLRVRAKVKFGDENYLLGSKFV